MSRALLAAFDLMQDLAGTVGPIPSLTVKDPPQTSRTPWEHVARFGIRDGTYEEVLLILETWEASKELARAVGKQRLARIQVRYTTGRGKGGEYTLAEIGPWSLAISRAVERVGVRDDRDASLVERYGSEGDTSQVDALLVWLSSWEASSLGTPRPAKKTPKPKPQPKPKAKAKPRTKPVAKARGKAKAKSKARRR